MATPSTLWFNSSYTVSTKSGTYGDTIQVYIKRSSSTYRHKIFAEIQDGNAWALVLGEYSDETTGEGASSAVKASYDSGVKDWGTIRAKLDSGLTLSPNSVITFYLYTYTSSKQLVGYTTRVVNMSLPNSNPSIPYCTTAPSSGDQYIQGYSKMYISADIYSGSESGVIDSFRYSTPGGEYILVNNPAVVSKGNGFYQIVQFETNNSISKYSGNNQSFHLRVTNTDGQISEYYNRGYSVVPYVVPKITAYGMSRYSYSNGTWTSDDSGEYLKYYFTASVNDLEGNTGTYKIQYKRTTASADTWQGTVVLSTGAKSYNVAQSAPAPLADPITSTNYVTLSADYAWTIRFSVTDSLGNYTSYQDMTLAVGLTTLDFLAGGKGIAVGKVAERVTSSTALGYDGLFDVGFDTRLRKNVQIDGNLTANGETIIGGNINVVGITTLDNPLSVDSGGTGTTSDSYTDGDLLLYDSSLGGYFSTTNSGNVADWLGLGNLAYEDSISVSDVGGLGDLATLDSVSLSGNYVSGTLPISRGGTNATTASSARSNLGLGSLATKSNVDLNSTDATGVLPDAKGGTGYNISSGYDAGALYHDAGTNYWTIKEVVAGTSGFISNTSISSTGISPGGMVVYTEYVSGFTADSVVFFTVAGSNCPNVTVTCSDRRSGRFSLNIYNNGSSVVHPSLYYLAIF